MCVSAERTGGFKHFKTISQSSPFQAQGEKNKTQLRPTYQVCIQLTWSLSHIEFHTLTIGEGTFKTGEEEGAKCGGRAFTSGKGHLYLQLMKFKRS